MSGLDELLGRVTADLKAVGAEHALVGGHAVSAQTEPRFTRDLDLVIAVPDDAEAEVVVSELAARGYRIVTLIEQETAGRLATVRLEHRDSPGVLVDLLFASSGIEPEVVAGATQLEFITLSRVPVASIGHLLALKVLSRDDQTRPQDRVDLAALLERASPHDVRVAEEALDTIERRGFDRGRDLQAAFARVRAELSA